MAVRESWEVFECDCEVKFAVSIENSEGLNLEQIECPVCGGTPHSSFSRHMDMLTIAENVAYLMNGPGPEQESEEPVIATVKFMGLTQTVLVKTSNIDYCNADGDCLLTVEQCQTFGKCVDCGIAKDYHATKSASEELLDEGKPEPVQVSKPPLTAEMLRCFKQRETSGRCAHCPVSHKVERRAGDNRCMVYLQFLAWLDAQPVEQGGTEDEV